MENTHFSEEDKRFMSLALDEAEQALASGDYPVGAVLPIDGVLFGKARNSIFTESQPAAHAEQKLLNSISTELRKKIRKEADYDICLYTTLEPCLMCLGVVILNRVTRIVISCPDPHGGATNINPDNLGSFYADHWPIIEIGLMKEIAVNRIIKFLKTEKFMSWDRMLTEFSKMKKGW